MADKVMVWCDLKIVTISNIVTNALEDFIMFKLEKNHSLPDGGPLYVCPSPDGSPDSYSCSDSGLHMPEELRGSIPTSTGTESPKYNNILHSFSFYYNNNKKKESRQLIYNIHHAMKRYLNTQMTDLKAEYEAKSDDEKQRDTTKATTALRRQQEQQKSATATAAAAAAAAATKAAAVAATAATALTAATATPAAAALTAAASAATTTPKTQRITKIRHKALKARCHPENDDDHKKGTKVHGLVTSTNPDTQAKVDGMTEDSLIIPLSTGEFYNGLAASEHEHGTITVRSSKDANKKKKKSTKKNKKKKRNDRKKRSKKRRADTSSSESSSDDEDDNSSTDGSG